MLSDLPEEDLAECSFKKSSVPINHDYFYPNFQMTSRDY